MKTNLSDNQENSLSSQKGESTPEVFDEKSCGVVLFFVDKTGNRKFLTLHYPDGHWDLVKGHVEADDESEKHTALREMEEETGIKQGEIFDGFRESISYTFRKNGKPTSKQVIFFVAKTTQEQVRLSHEHHDHLWLSYEEMMKKLTFDNAQSIVRKAEQFLRAL